MIQITKIIETETGHRLTSYPSKCAHLHGHRYRWEVTVTAPKLDHVGFVMDYSDLKRVLTRTIDKIDHAFIFHDQDPLIQYMLDTENKYLLDATNGDKGRVFLVPFNPTSENLVPWMANRIIAELPAPVQLTAIRMWETSTSYCDWTA